MEGGGMVEEDLKGVSIVAFFCFFFDIELGYCHVEKNSLDFLGN